MSGDALVAAPQASCELAEARDQLVGYCGETKIVSGIARRETDTYSACTRRCRLVVAEG